jgi:hypothetical protein
VFLQKRRSQRAYKAGEERRGITKHRIIAERQTRGAQRSRQSKRRSDTRLEEDAVNEWRYTDSEVEETEYRWPGYAGYLFGMFVIRVVVVVFVVECAGGGVLDAPGGRR